MRPTLSQHWYLATQLFDRDAPFFRLALLLLAVGFALPLALRLPPPLALSLQTGITTLLRPYTTAGDLARSCTLYALHCRLLQGLGAPCLLLLGTVLAALAVLVPSMWAAWVVTASANANYLYAATTALGVWQGTVVLLLARAALRGGKGRKAE